MKIYLIKRGSRPEYHRAPYHPVIVCAKRRIAKWEAGATDKRAWVWEWNCDNTGFLLCRWNGLDIDYGHVVRCFNLPDGARTGFFHDRLSEPWTLLQGAIWWDDKKLPPSLQKTGIVYPSDEFTQQVILDSIANDSVWGNERKRPSHRPEWLTNKKLNDRGK